MSEIKKLIERLCPDGVEYIELGVIAQVIRGERITKRDLVEDGEYPVMSGGVSYFGRYTNYNREANTITVAQYGSAGYVSFIKEKFWANDVCYSVLPSERLNNKYCYYVLCNLQNTLYSLTTKAIPDCLPKEKLTSLEIPVPPIEVQSKIVEILDNFTELEAELEARRKQYEYYRDNLFCKSTDIKKIGDLTKVFSCPRVFRNQWKKSGIPFWRSSDVMSYHNGVKNPRGEVYISQSLYLELSRKSERIEKGDLLVTGGGSIGMPYLKMDDNPLFVKDADLICIKRCDSFIPSYLYHFFFTTEFRTYLKKITHDATIAHYTINQIKDTPIPIPPLSEQQRIVSILDRFEALTTDLQSGLPAEIEARRKQYEYYREKLLTFKQKSA